MIKLLSGPDISVFDHYFFSTVDIFIMFTGIVAKPRAMILDITEDQALLQCEVRGAFPKPQISWIDSDGTILPATEKLENSDDLHYSPALTLQTTVTKTGIFRCRVTQQELNHTTDDQISVDFFSKFGLSDVHKLQVFYKWKFSFFISQLVRKQRSRHMKAALELTGLRPPPPLNNSGIKSN
uniref:Ig-like domain-containing protein n=1 Tax=Acanthochromis polyacanthus TaxID=80966 RepID=A0A3Q1ECE8_9TELE